MQLNVVACYIIFILTTWFL